jgi:hypothetical protein
MNDREKIACQYVLESIDIFKDTSLLRDIQNSLIVEIFPITLDDYRILCSRLVAKYFGPLATMFIQLDGEELKKQLPDHVSEIEQERVKYLTVTYNQFSV